MKERGTVLAVDDEPSSLDLIERILAGEGLEVVTASSAEAALAAAGERAIDLVVSDIRMGGMDGMALLDVVRRRWPDVPVILVTAFGSVDDAMRAIKRGAYDYISKPYNVDNIVLVVERALRERRLARELQRLRRVAEPFRLDTIVGRSNVMLEVFKAVARVAGSDAPVLITGESGTGKELVARTIHTEGRGGNFVAINCGAVNEGVLESELFGHRKGAFSDAKADRRGVFVAADGGTLLLDEVGEVPPRMQATLLRVLQEGEVRPVGSSEPVMVDVRVLATTNRDLEQEVRDGRFREDLLYRLNVILLHLPPLRERRDDIVALAEHFLAKYSEGSETVFTEQAIERLMNHSWPGNVRELENVVARAVALRRGRTILADDLPLAEGTAPARRSARTEWPTLAAFTRQYVDDALAHVGGNKRAAADLLGVDRKTLYRILGGGAQRPTSLGRRAVEDGEDA